MCVISRISKIFLLGVLTLIVAACGGGDGGFTSGGPEDSLEITIQVTDTTLPANLTNQQPSLLLPFTTSVIVRVEKTDGTLVENGTIVQLAVDGLRHGAITTLDDPETEDDNEFLILLGSGFDETGSGQVQFFFTSFSEPGVSTLTASVLDPVSGRTISATAQITVTDIDREVASLTFTGPFVNAVLTGQSSFGIGALQNGTYSRVVSVVANDANGNPMPQGTPINFFLMDTPITGYPVDGPGSFFIAGDDGNPLEGGFRFNAPGGSFLSLGARATDRLVLDGKQFIPVPDTPLPDNAHHTAIRVVQTILSQNELIIQQSGSPFNQRVDSADTGATVPYIIGRARHGTILATGFTNAAGVADTVLTYPVFRILQTAVLVACSTDNLVCATLNTCDRQGNNCNSVYLDVTNGIDRILTVSGTTFAPNSTSDLELCLLDVNRTPLPGETITYDISNIGSATVTINGVASETGSFITGADGCVTITIVSSGQIEGSAPILITFDSDNVAQAVEVSILGPAGGNLLGIVNVAGGSGTIELQLIDNNGIPIPDTFISNTFTTTDEDNTCAADEEVAGSFDRDNLIPGASVSYTPSTQLTDSEGRLTANVELFGDNGDTITIIFSSLRGSTFTVTFTIIQEGFPTCPG